MPHNLTDSSTFTNPVPAPADGDNDAQATFDPAFQALANRTKFLLDKALGGYTSWPQTQGVTVSPVDIVPMPVYVVPGGAATAVALNTQWRAHYTNASGGGPGGRDLITPTGKVYTSLTFHTGTLSLKRHVPGGATITAITVSVVAGSAQATSTNRIAVELASYTAGSRTTIASATCGSGAGAQDIALTSLGLAIDLAGQSYVLNITSSAGAGGGTEDYIVDVFIAYTMPFAARS